MDRRLFLLGVAPHESFLPWTVLGGAAVGGFEGVLTGAEPADPGLKGH